MINTIVKIIINPRGGGNLIWTLASLDESEIKSISSLEEEIRVNILAFSSQDIEIADISKGELDKIENLEKELGISLVAVKK